MTPVHYLVLGGGYTGYDDSTVYAEKDYDYSAWPTGLSSFDSRGYGATYIPTGGKYWFRHEIVLASTSGVTFHYSVDDVVELWIDGVLAFTATPGGGDTYTYAIPPSKLKVGCNHIAVSCKDTTPVNAFIYWRFEQV